MATSTSAPPTSAGSPATATSSTARWPTAPPTVMFESDAHLPRRRAATGRWWTTSGSTIFYTAPTAIRAIAREGDEWVRKLRRDSACGCSAPSASRSTPRPGEWYHDVVGNGRCAIVDTWWQTETGGILITPLPGVIPAKPGSATLPFFGVEPVLVDDERQGPRRQRRLGQPLHRRARLAGPGADGLRRPRTLPRDLLHPVPRALLHR